MNNLNFNLSHKVENMKSTNLNQEMGCLNAKDVYLANVITLPLQNNSKNAKLDSHEQNISKDNSEKNCKNNSSNAVTAENGLLKSENTKDQKKSLQTDENSTLKSLIMVLPELVVFFIMFGLRLKEEIERSNFIEFATTYYSNHNLVNKKKELLKHYSIFLRGLTLLQKKMPPFRFIFRFVSSFRYCISATTYNKKPYLSAFRKIHSIVPFNQIKENITPYIDHFFSNCGGLADRIYRKEASCTIYYEDFSDDTDFDPEFILNSLLSSADSSVRCYAEEMFQRLHLLDFRFLMFFANLLYYMPTYLTIEELIILTVLINNATEVGVKINVEATADITGLDPGTIRKYYKSLCNKWPDILKKEKDLFKFLIKANKKLNKKRLIIRDIKQAA